MKGDASAAKWIFNVPLVDFKERRGTGVRSEGVRRLTTGGLKGPASCVRSAFTSIAYYSDEFAQREEGGRFEVEDINAVKF